MTTESWVLTANCSRELSADTQEFKKKSKNSTEFLGADAQDPRARIKLRLRWHPWPGYHRQHENELLQTFGSDTDSGGHWSRAVLHILTRVKCTRRVKTRLSHSSTGPNTDQRPQTELRREIIPLSHYFFSCRKWCHSQILESQRPWPG